MSYFPDFNMSKLGSKINWQNQGPYKAVLFLLGGAQFAPSWNWIDNFELSVPHVPLEIILPNNSSGTALYLVSKVVVKILTNCDMQFHTEYFPSQK